MRHASQRDEGPDQRSPSDKIPPHEQVPFAIRCTNFVALVVLGFILVPAAVVRLEQLMVVLPVLLLLISAYWVHQKKPTVAVLSLALSTSLVLWIIICENIISIDNLLGSHITKALNLNVRLQTVAHTQLKKHDQPWQECCGVPLSFNYKPGSLFQRRYDCGQFNKRYVITVDETGFLNRQQHLSADGKQVDIFMAGDSVLQGFGVASVVETLNQSLPVATWNLSASAYGPQQKVNAVLTYALPRRPKSIIIEFYASNDISDEVRNKICEGSTFYCIFNSAEKRRRLARHSEFSSMVDSSRESVDIFADYTGGNLTLAVTRFLVDNVKGKMKATLGWSEEGSPCNKVESYKESVDEMYRKHFSVSDTPQAFPGFSEFQPQPGKKDEWLKKGMQLTYKSYDKLASAIEKEPSRPEVILLYNPSTYEIYRNVVFDVDREADRISEFQRRALRHYAEEHGWRFLDITSSLHNELALDGVWLYGVDDRVHWSRRGTVAVGLILARELLLVIGKESGSILSPNVPLLFSTKVL